MSNSTELKLLKIRESEKQEKLSCPFCNPNTHYGASPEFFDQWKIKHQYHV